MSDNTARYMPFVNNGYGYYHVYNIAVHNNLIFKDHKDYDTFLGYLFEYLTPPPDPEELKTTFTVRGKQFKGRPHTRKNYFGKIKLVSYSLSPDHYHLLLQTTDGTLPQGLIRSLCTRYSMYFNKRHKRYGSLYQGPYRSIKLNDITYLPHLVRYINNHKTGKSSYKAYVSPEANNILEQDIVYQVLENISNGLFSGVNGYKLFSEEYELNPLESSLLDRYIIEERHKDNTVNAEIPLEETSILYSYNQTSTAPIITEEPEYHPEKIPRVFKCPDLLTPYLLENVVFTENIDVSIPIQNETKTSTSVPDIPVPIPTPSVIQINDLTHNKATKVNNIEKTTSPTELTQRGSLIKRGKTAIKSRLPEYIIISLVFVLLFTISLRNVQSKIESRKLVGNIDYVVMDSTESSESSMSGVLDVIESSESATAVAGISDIRNTDAEQSTPSAELETKESSEKTSLEENTQTENQENTESTQDTATDSDETSAIEATGGTNTRETVAGSSTDQTNTIQETDQEESNTEQSTNTNAANNAETKVKILEDLDRVIIRNGPSTDATKQGEVVGGVTFKLISIEGDWVKVDLGHSQEGYIFEELVEVLGGNQ